MRSHRECDNALCNKTHAITLDVLLGGKHLHQEYYCLPHTIARKVDINKDARLSLEREHIDEKYLTCMWQMCDLQTSWLFEVKDHDQKIYTLEHWCYEHSLRRKKALDISPRYELTGSKKI